MVRLFIGVNAVGLWDELFFICTAFALFRRHFPLWQANILQATIFVSFLWELGYQSWGPLLTCRSLWCRDTSSTGPDPCRTSCARI